MAILDLKVTGGAIEVAIEAALAIAVAIVVAIARAREGEGMNAVSYFGERRAGFT